MVLNSLAAFIVNFLASSSPYSKESTPLVFPSSPKRADISPKLPFSTSTPLLKISRETLVLNLVAPAPTGSSTIGFPNSFAISVAFTIDLLHPESRVPIFMTTASASLIISSSSSSAWAITGEAPNASKAFAVVFITTKFVMLWTRGLLSLTLLRASMMNFILTAP
ncbi:165aa long hypothetical protein [Pyrococcus horikoshii OT3]|uniref:Uncharacterized protein n=1 Tax=Pyrococcus horikoshii (strain ATCC 700860 / DSM 12428 / JCM 9974 / NBRC 100139 / OT-3) TaxID=70601 RepID=O58876_PYRHO|nr:165aa long hypothetical protein [Pyrococcus horikoshii OT3]